MAGNEKLMALAQQKMFIAASPKEALKMAAKELNIKLSAAEEQEILSTLNGSANWGKTMDEYAFDSTKASEYKKDAQLAQAKAKVKQVKSNTQKRAELQNQIAERKEKYGAFIGGAMSLYDGFKYNMIPEKDGVEHAGFGKALVALGLAVATVAATTSCDRKDDITNYEFKNEDKTEIKVPITVVNENSSFAELVAALKEAIDGLRSDLDDIKNLIVAVITNQEKQAANAEAYVQMILNAIGDNTALIKIVIEKLTESNDTLKGLKELIVKNHEEDKEYQKKALELLAGIKFSVDQLGGDLGKYFENVINAMVKQNVSLEKIEALLTTLNKSVENLNKLIKTYGDKGEKLGQAILAAIGKFNFNVNVDLSGIEALLKRLIDGQKLTNDKIDNLTKLFNKYSADTIAKLNTIIAMMGNDSAKLDAILDLMAKMDANNEDRTERILAAIEKLGTNVVVSLDAIIAKMDKNSPDYSKQLNKIIELLEQLDKNNEARNEKVLAAIAKLGVDVTADLAAILDAIKALPASEQKDYTKILNAILDKIKEGNAANDANFKAVLAKIKDLGVSVAYGMNAILEAIQNQPDYTAKLDAIIAKLNALGDKAQEILEAIKDHDVKITVDVTGKVKCECNCNCGGTHEGIIGDLNNLLG